MSFKNEGRFYRGTGHFAGRFDTLAECHGAYQGVIFDGVYVLDYKSAKDPKKWNPTGYPEWRMQTSAYRKGCEQTLGIVPDGNATVRLDKLTGVPDIYDQSNSYERDLNSFRALCRFYHSEYGDRMKRGVPSVTTILGVLNKPALVQWAANTCADYIWQETEGVVELSRGELGGMLAMAKKNWRKLKQDAADKGTEVHKLIEVFLNTGKLPHYPTLSLPVEQAFKAFMEFYENVDMKVIEQEVSIIGTFE